MSVYLKLLFCLIILLTGCSAMDDAPIPRIVYASAWEFSAQSPQAIAVEKEWWKNFNSLQLTVLIDTAHQQNPDVLIAGERVKQAELQMNIASASLFPSLGLSAASSEKRTKAKNGNWVGSQSTTAGFTAIYELDLWGGEMANRHASAFNYKSVIFANEASRLSISAAVATAWFNYLSLQERIHTAQKNSAIAERIQHIVESLYRNGAASAADLAAQKTNRLNQQNLLFPLQLQLDQTRAAIALLEGQSPQAYQLPVERIDAVNIPIITVGIPSDIIFRRPDIASIEAQLHAASANVYTARTALLPSVQLAGNAGESASEIFSLSPAIQTAGWSISLAQTIFAGGRVKNQVRLSESRQQELLEQYRKTILIALQEVDDALNRTNIAQQQEVNQQEIVVQAERSLALSEVQYREGGLSLQALLDSQRSLFQAQDTLVQQRLARLKAAIDLYKALGGGWIHAAT